MDAVTDSTTTKTVKMYSTTWCGDCQVTKNFLKKLSIPFEEVNIEEHPEAAEYVMKVNNGKRSVPTLVVNGEATSLSGFSRAKFEAFVTKHQLA
jgi:mycoredoxin